MDVKTRIRMSRLLEKMKQQQEFSEKLRLENQSSFHGKRIGEDKKC